MTPEQYALAAEIGMGTLGLIVALGALRVALAALRLRREARSLRPPSNDSDRPRPE